MATLVGAADDSEADVVWTISEDVEDATEYFQVDDEVVRVIANFHSSIYAPTGLLTPPSIRVERGAGGTAAASHSDGATLTPVIPPSTGGGGDGETNVYVQPTDPGAVGAGKLWSNTDVDPPVLQVRDAVDGAWLATAGETPTLAEVMDEGHIAAGTLDMADSQIVGLAEPSNSGDAANKGYVDDRLLGAVIDPLPEVPASPTEQDIVDALLALGLVTQAP